MLAVGDTVHTPHGLARVAGVPLEHGIWTGEYGRDAIDPTRLRYFYLVVLLDGSEKAYLLPGEVLRK